MFKFGYFDNAALTSHFILFVLAPHKPMIGLPCGHGGNDKLLGGCNGDTLLHEGGEVELHGKGDNNKLSDKGDKEQLH